MKLLIIGLDGGDVDIIQRMDMPCLQQLLQERVSVPIREDLWSRGWSEIACGMEGIDTGAFYEKPKLDGTIKFSQGYTTDDYYKVPGCQPIWDVLTAKGQSLGFVNLPTSIPAPEVSGFFVSGAGSGFSPSSRVPEVACYPKEISYDLLKRNFIWEQRLQVSGIQDTDYFIDRCIRTVLERGNVFIDLCKKFKVDVGLLMQKEPVMIQNLFMHKIQPLLDNPNASAQTLQRRIQEFYRVLDDSVKVTLQELQPQSIMIFSDHAARCYLKSLNLNSFLKDAGYFFTDRNQKSRNGSTKLSQLKSTFLNKVSKSILTRSNVEFDENFKRNSWKFIGNMDVRTTKAFSNRYVPGIYLNDSRFHGVVRDAEKETLIRAIISDFNSSSEAKKFKMHAMPYREKFYGKYAEKLLPEIWINLPDTIFPEQAGLFIQDNPNWTDYNDLKYARRDIMTGMKGRNAICSVEKEFLGDVDINTEHNLTVAYKLILNHV